jgi:hypothetical protein
MNCPLNGRRKYFRQLNKNGCSATFPLGEAMNAPESDVKMKRQGTILFEMQSFARADHSKTPAAAGGGRRAGR